MFNTKKMYNLKLNCIYNSFNEQSNHVTQITLSKKSEQTFKMKKPRFSGKPRHPVTLTKQVHSLRQWLGILTQYD